MLNNIVPIICVLMLGAGFIFHINFKYKVGGTLKGPVRVKKLKPLNYETMVFIATYIIPLAGFNFDSFRQILLFVMLVASIGAIYIKIKVFHTNPSLVLLGYRLYRLDADKMDRPAYKEVMVIASCDIYEEDSVSYMSLSDNLLFVRKTTKL